ncbi:multicopper oxidase domain-containing protein [Pikeienuella sp. HZG-20]|uniref:multicopper oxidase domain-containing protein n=1 Tax=Paludibacillus litoralis TaxID=3133267 RepID=UPI0030EC7759
MCCGEEKTRPMTMTRRDLMMAVSAAGFAAGLPRPIQARAGGGVLQMPPLLDVTYSSAFDLIARAGETAFMGRAASSTWGFNDQTFLGPTLRLAADGAVAASVTNLLTEPFALHWHGLLAPGHADGGPHLPITPDGKWSIELDINQPPATIWYHSHTHSRTADHVQKGLAGVIQLTDGRDDERGLPAEYGIDDLTLVIQDRRFDGRGRMIYDPGMRDEMMGLTGDMILVNGQVNARAVAPRGIVRLRLPNGSNARIYDLASRAGRSLHLIATDTGFLDRPTALKTLRLAPGERAEVLIDFTDGADDVLVSGPNPNGGMMGGMMGQRGMMGGMMRGRGMMGRAEEAGFDILPTEVDSTRATRVDRLPENLGGAMPDLDTRNAPRRDITLQTGMGGMMRRSGNRHSINGQPFDMDRLNFSVRKGATEIWKIEGQMMAHPLHIHGVMFQVLSENGGPVSPRNRVWKDTVLVDGRVEIAVRFDQSATTDTPFMFHRHILEHEDGGMMGQFAVT